MKKQINMKVILLVQVLFLGIGFIWTNMVNGGMSGKLYTLYLDLPYALCMLCFIIPGIYVMGIGKDLRKAISVGQKKYSLIELKRVYEALKALEKLNFLGAAFVAFISLIWLLQSINLEKLGATFVTVGICLIPVFYMLVIEYLLLPLIVNVQREINEVMAIDEED